MVKKVKVIFNNREGKMVLTVKGKRSVEQALKISKAFDDACREIRAEDDK